MFSLIPHVPYIRHEKPYGLAAVGQGQEGSLNLVGIKISTKVWFKISKHDHQTQHIDQKIKIKDQV